MSRQTTIVAAALGAAIALMSAPVALAQKTCKLMMPADAAESTYPEQYTIDIGDVPGHQIRIYSVHRIYNEKATSDCEDKKRKEARFYGYSDYINRNGSTSGYGHITMENGDNIFFRFAGTSQTVTTADGKKKSTYTGITTYTGGTGIYQGIRGIERDTVRFDPDANINIAEQQIEYSIKK